MVVLGIFSLMVLMNSIHIEAQETEIASSTVRSETQEPDWKRQTASPEVSKDVREKADEVAPAAPSAGSTSSGSSFLNFATILSNLVWGLPNTIVGGAIAAVSMIASPIFKGEMPTFSASPNGKQIHVGNSILPLPGYEMSLGLFHLDSNDYTGGSVAAHEGGHADQSALLGPLYLPVIGVDYAKNSHSGSFMEDWADDLGGVD